jgi:hypothetical protein
MMLIISNLGVQHPNQFVFVSSCPAPLFDSNISSILATRRKEIFISTISASAADATRRNLPTHKVHFFFINHQTAQLRDES